MFGLNLDHACAGILEYHAIQLYWSPAGKIQEDMADLLLLSNANF